MKFESLDILTDEELSKQYNDIIELGNEQNIIAEYHGPGDYCNPCIKNGRYDYQCTWYYNYSWVSVYCPKFGTGTTYAGSCYYGMCNAVGAMSEKDLR